jgi:hypothetical protein
VPHRGMIGCPIGPEFFSGKRDRSPRRRFWSFGVWLFIGADFSTAEAELTLRRNSFARMSRRRSQRPGRSSSVATAAALRYGKTQNGFTASNHRNRKPISSRQPPASVAAHRKIATSLATKAPVFLAYNRRCHLSRSVNEAGASEGFGLRLKVSRGRSNGTRGIAPVPSNREGDCFRCSPIDCPEADRRRMHVPQTPEPTLGSAQRLPCCPEIGSCFAIAARRRWTGPLG